MGNKRWGFSAAEIIWVGCLFSKLTFFIWSPKLKYSNHLKPRHSTPGNTHILGNQVHKWQILKYLIKVYTFITETIILKFDCYKSWLYQNERLNDKIKKTSFGHLGTFNIHPAHVDINYIFKFITFWEPIYFSSNLSEIFFRSHLAPVFSTYFGRPIDEGPIN